MTTPSTSWMTSLLPPSLQKESAQRQLDYLLDDMVSKFKEIELVKWNKSCKDAWIRNHPDVIIVKKENPYNTFVKENYAEVKQMLGKTKKHADVLVKLAEIYRTQKQHECDSTATPEVDTKTKSNVRSRR